MIQEAQKMISSLSIYIQMINCMKEQKNNLFASPFLKTIFKIAKSVTIR